MSQASSTGTGGAATRRLATAAPEHDHLVVFYDDDAALVEAVERFLRPAAAADEIAIVVSTPEHYADAVAALEASTGIAEARLRERLRFLDATATLAAICDDTGALSSARFQAVIGDVVDDATAGQHGVRIFGEMVALQWRDGNIAGAIGLEDLWNDLLGDRPFGLLCAYPSTLFDDPSVTEAFRTMCGQHHDVIPPGSFVELSETDQRRAVALLQQESRAFRRSELALMRRLEEMDDDLDDAARRDDDRRALIAMIAHDLGSPTGVLRGVLEILRSDWSELDEDAIEELLHVAGVNAARIGRLATDVLTLGRMEAGRFSMNLRPVDLGDLVDDIVDEFRATSGRTVELEVDAALPLVRADADRQVQVLHNLLSNAAKYSTEGSSISVTVAQIEDGSQLQVCVHDRGEGIADKDLGSLFRPFSRLGDEEGTARPGGAGLGLFIAKALVEGQGGTITADSVEGRGSSFCYTVPLTSAD